MPVPRGLAMAVIPIALLVGCAERGATTIERLEAAIAAHADGATEPTDEQIDALFARLDADVAAARADAAEERGDGRDAAQARARELERQRTRLTKAYLDAKIARFGDTMAETVRDVGRKIGAGIEETGRQMRESLGEDDTAPPSE